MYQYGEEQELQLTRELLKETVMGWWVADFSDRTIVCSPALCEGLGLTDGSMTFDQFFQSIREDYREHITQAFESLGMSSEYDVTYPLHSLWGELWGHAHVIRRETTPDGHLFVYGFWQHVEPPAEERQRAERRINSLLYHQLSVAQSLTHFLKSANDDEVIYSVLDDVLHYYHAGRVVLYECDKAFTTQTCLYEVTAPGVYSMSEEQKTEKLPIIDWWYNQLREQGHVVVNDRELLPPEAEIAHALLKRLGVRSHLAVAMLGEEGKVRGFLGVDILQDTHVWTTEEIQWLSSLSGIITICVDLMHTRNDAVAERNMLFSIFNNVPVGIEIYDQDGLLININQKDMEIFGVQRKRDVLGVSLWQCPNLSPALIERVKQEPTIDVRLDYPFKRVGHYYQTEKRGMLKLFTRFCQLRDKSGNLQGYMAINLDRTNELDSLSRIQEFESLFLLVSQFAKVGYAKLNLLNAQGFAIDQWYLNLGEKLDKPLQEVVGIYEHVHPDDRAKLLQFYEEAKQGKCRQFSQLLRVQRPDAPEGVWNYIVDHVVVGTYEPENDVVELVAINYDVTEQKELEQKLVLAKERAEEADRLKTAFLANMSHEIRTPLNAIVGFSSLIADSKTEQDKKQFMHLVEENNALLLQLVDDILDFSKMEAGTFEISLQEVDVHRLCSEVVHKMLAKVRPGVMLTMNTTVPGDFRITTDGHRVAQVLENFLTNAVKFTLRGSITLSFEQPDEHTLRFCVSDTGIGIAPEACQSIFDRFVKLNSFVQGTGLGLAICKGIVDRLGGRIGVDSQLGQGSTFWFTLPI